MNNPFSIENQYQKYLKLVKLDEATMPAIQKRQLRQTFFAACGQMLLMLRDDLAPLPEKMAVATLQNMIDQVSIHLTHNKN